MATFEEFIANPATEKVILAHIEPGQRIVSAWTLVSGFIYKTSVEYFVVDSRVDGVSLIEANSTSLSAGEWYFDSQTKEIYIRLSDNSNPNDSFVSVIYRFFYSNRPTILPYDLSAGREVEYFGAISSISNFKNEIDADDLTGIALTGSGTISLNNNDGGFDAIFDKLFWEGANIKIWMWSPGIDVIEAQKIYQGKVDSKSFSPQRVSFKVKDFVDQLRNEIPLPNFTTSDGELPSSIIGKPKRRIYGQVDGLSCVSLDQSLDGYDVPGTYSSSYNAVLDRTTLTGTISGIDQLAFNGDKVVYQDADGDEIEITVYSTTSNTISVVGKIDPQLNGNTIKIKPDIPFVGRNRNWFICHHAMRSPQTTVDTPISENRFTVTDATDLFNGDRIQVGIEFKRIRRVSSNTIVLDTNLLSVPTVGTSVSKLPVQEVYYEKEPLVFNRDYTITNTATLSKIVINESAEFNIAPEIELEGTLQFNNGSTLVSGSGIDLLRDLRRGDWIKPRLTDTYYQVVRVVNEFLCEIKDPYAATNVTSEARRKRPVYIDDNSNITVNALGKTKDNTPAGVWIKTPADAVLDILQEQNLTDQLVTSTFDEAAIDAPYTVSLKLPLRPFNRKPKVKDVITLLNDSCFGSLHNNKDYDIVYNVLTPKKPEIDRTLRDDDIVSYSIQSSGKNVTRTVIGNYRHLDYDRLREDQNTSASYIRENDFVSNISNVTREEVRELYLYNDTEAEIITQRISLLREFANLVLQIKTKINLYDKNINDLVYFEFDRLFQRFGTLDDQNRIGIITSIAKGETDANITVTDLSGLYNKVCTFAPSTANIYTSSSRTDRATQGYWTDTKGLIDSLEYLYRMNLFG